VKILRAWVDSSGKFRKNGMALPMLAMETEMKTQRTTRGDKGFTLTELLVVICVVAVMVALILPMLAAAKRGGGPNHCVNYLKQIGLAFQIWEGDNGSKFPMQVSVTNGGAMELALTGDIAGIFRTMSNELSTPKFLTCSQDTKRIAATDFAGGLSDANISYFVGLDAEDKYPQMIISGDDNLEVNGVRVRPGIFNLWTNAPVEWTPDERHGRDQQWHIRKPHWRVGNIGLVDGSVLTTTVLTFQSALVNTGTATNRLVIP
jgi:prepilin-type N-terminal cleavage/methylation domain-containing protein